MKTLLRILLFFMFLILMHASGLPTQNSVVAKRIVVQAHKGWQNSGILLKKNQYYSIIARGSWISGYEKLAYGPEGRGTGTITDNALVGWIEKEQPQRLNYDSYKREIVGKVIFIGREATLISYEDGILWLAMGDWSGCKECTGELEVLITTYD